MWIHIYACLLLLFPPFKTRNVRYTTLGFSRSNGIMNQYNTLLHFTRNNLSTGPMVILLNSIFPWGPGLEQVHPITSHCWTYESTNEDRIVELNCFCHNWMALNKIPILPCKIAFSNLLKVQKELQTNNFRSNSMFKTSKFLALNTSRGKLHHWVTDHLCIDISSQQWF